MTEEIREVAEAREAVINQAINYAVAPLGTGSEALHDAIDDLVEAVRKDERGRLLGIADLLVEAGALDDDGPLGRAYLMLDIAMLTIPAEGGTEG